MYSLLLAKCSPSYSACFLLTNIGSATHVKVLAWSSNKTEELYPAQETSISMRARRRSGGYLTGTGKSC